MGRSTKEAVETLTEQGWTPREIANQLGISVPAVYQHLYKLRKEKQNKPDEEATTAS